MTVTLRDRSLSVDRRPYSDTPPHPAPTASERSTAVTPLNPARYRRWPVGCCSSPVPKETLMAKYLLLKHYRGGPAPVVDIDPIDQWAPAEVDAHIQWMRDFATRLKETGEYVNDQALSPGGTFVRYGGE